MKKTYIIPLTTIETTETELIIATSKLSTTDDTQNITLYEGEYNGEFAVKESDQDWDW